MTTIYILGAILVGYVLPAVVSWVLARKIYREVWTDVKPNGIDALVVISPALNISACIAFSSIVAQHSGAKTFGEKFFRL